MKGSEGFKPSHLHPRLVGQVFKWATFLAQVKQLNEGLKVLNLGSELTINEIIINDLIIN